MGVEHQWSNRDYREILRAEYQVRLERNPKYSLRAFARDLEVAPSRIVEVLNYKRGLSRVVASRMVRRLGFTDSESQTFLQLVDSVHGRSQLVRSQALRSLKQNQKVAPDPLQADTFKLIADWYHYAILELTNLEDFQSDSSWIGKRLGVPSTLIDEAIRRLKRLKLLKEVKGRLQSVDTATFSTNDIPSDGLKKHHEQILQKAQQAIYLQSVDERNLSAITIAIDRKDISKAKQKIRKFVADLMFELAGTPKKDAVYCLSHQFFRLDLKDSSKPVQSKKGETL